MTEIGQTAFYQCEKLESVTFEAGSQLKKIGNYVFALCSALTSIEIPASVTEIGYGAFNRCSSLVTVHCRPVTPPTLGYGVFNSNASGRKIYVPASSVEDYKTDANWSTYADDIIGE